jgi:hypothetical protein
MRKLYMLLLLTIPFLTAAQNSPGYMIFQSMGDITLNRGNKTIQKLEGEKFLPGDHLTISKGWISFLDQQMKRVTLSEPCQVSFETLVSLFKKTTASMENKYLVYLWEKMNAEEHHATVPGGAIRGKQLLRFPYDSAIVLSSNFCFSFKNPSKEPLILVIKNWQHEPVFRIQTTDSLVCVDSIDFSSWKPGNYYWTIHHEKAMEPEARLMIIPSADEKKKLEKEFKDFCKKLKDIPSPESDQVLKQIIDLKKWIMN